jgi:hypothetical protein
MIPPPGFFARAIVQKFYHKAIVILAILEAMAVGHGIIFTKRLYNAPNGHYWPLADAQAS